MDREHLATLVWSELPAARAVGALKEALGQLRSDLEAPDLVMGGQVLRLNPQCITSDIEELRRASAAGDHGAVVAAFGGPLLDDVLHDDASPGFTQLVEQHRLVLNAAFLRSAEIEAMDAQAAGDVRRAIQLWRRLTSHEPLSGYYALGLIRALAAAGDRTGALQFGRVYEGLVEQQAWAPDPAVHAAVEALRRGEVLESQPAAGNLSPESGPTAASAGMAPDDAASAGDSPFPGGPADAAASGPQPHSQAGINRSGEHRRVTPAAAGLTLTPSEGTSPVLRAEDRKRRKRRRSVILGAALIGPIGVATILAASQLRQLAASESYDDNRIVVLPCESEDNSVPTDIRDCDALIRHALQRWTDLDVVDPLVLDDRLQRTRVSTHDDRMRLASDVGAAYAVVARVSDSPRGSVVQATLHDVRSRKSLRTHDVQVGTSLNDATQQMHNLMAALLSYGSTQPDAPSPLGTSRLSAWRAMQAGWAAVGRWDLAAARDHFAIAVEEDSSYALASYWLAEVEHWRGELPRSVWGGMAARAVARSDELSDRQARQARALAHLAQRSYDLACEEYDDLIRQDSVNVVAWLGRAECHADDSGVLPDSRSRTGWSFRGSRSAAMQSYARALALAPTAFRMFAMPRFARLRAIYPTNPHAAISGRAVHDQTMQFIAFPELQGDSIAFTPMPLVAGRVLDPSLMPSSRAVAAQRAARQLRDLTSLWVNADPDDPSAHEAHAMALEENGEVMATLSGNDALWHARRAATLLGERSVLNTDAHALRLGVMEVRLLLKRGAFAEAHDKGVGLLALAENVDPGGAREILPVAALLGRVAEQEALEQRAAPGGLARRSDLMDVPGVRRAAAEQSLLLAAITGGLPTSEVQSRYARMVQTVEDAVPAELQERVLDALLLEVAHLGMLQLPPDAEPALRRLPPLPLLRAQLDLRDGDIEGARAVVQEKIADMRQQGEPPGLPTGWPLPDWRSRSGTRPQPSRCWIVDCRRFRGLHRIFFRCLMWLLQFRNWQRCDRDFGVPAVRSRKRLSGQPQRRHCDVPQTRRFVEEQFADAEAPADVPSGMRRQPHECDGEAH